MGYIGAWGDMMNCVHAEELLEAQGFMLDCICHVARDEVTKVWTGPDRNLGTHLEHLHFIISSTNCNHRTFQQIMLGCGFRSLILILREV